MNSEEHIESRKKQSSKLIEFEAKNRPDDPLTWFNYSRQLIYENRFEDAMFAALRTIRLLKDKKTCEEMSSSSFLSIYFALHTACAELNDWHTAVFHLREAVQIQPYYIDGWFALGQNACFRLDMVEAERCFSNYFRMRKAVRQNPALANVELWSLDFESEARFYLGMAAASIGARAESEFEIIESHGSEQSKRFLESFRQQITEP